MYIGIATSGRAPILNEVLRDLSRQETPPARVLVCPAREEDLDFPPNETLPFEVERVHSTPGACVQRNAIMDRLSMERDGVLLFMDDDFFLRADYISELSKLFQSQHDVVMATGTVLADGAPGPGLSVEESLAILAADRDDVPERIEPVYNGYGCNMAVRLETAERHSLRFDAEMPLYAWLEDVDFSRRLAAHGRLVSSTRLRGVHMGVKRGRGSGVRLGYSQIANPWYLMRKRTMRPDLAARQALRNIAANVAKMGRPEPWVDRKGRVKGNLLAVADLLRGRIHPRNILSL
ncbi:glycosyltransferase family 2 protein [Aureimonas ureilytica]|uniref:glycosyltransferase family 2 protein n=1 Tax=Aureimonas ureilytica TaxID=401562 RepID=UPI001FCDF0BC|nr:glycosyltransferase [Aureimonas ureilytica]